MNWKKTLLILSIMPAALWARKGESTPGLSGPDHFEPWFTGPLLAPSGHVIPLSHQNIEPYVYYNRNLGHFDNHWRPHKDPTFTNVYNQIALQFGVLPGVELDLNPTFSYNNTQSKHTWVVNDAPIAVGVQLLLDDPETWHPAIKMRFGFNLPVGRYDKLNPEKLGTDFGGFGAWYPSFGFVFSRVFHIYGHHYLSWRQALNYTWGTSIRIHGLSTHGGAPPVGPFRGTHGTVYPGNAFVSVTGFEYSLDQNWVLALDIYYQYTNRRRFHGYSPPGTKPTHPSREQFSLAQAIEYNFTENIGVIAGPWFSVTGRNSLEFFNWVFAINIFH